MTGNLDCQLDSDERYIGWYSGVWTSLRGCFQRLAKQGCALVVGRRVYEAAAQVEYQGKSRKSKAQESLSPLSGHHSHAPTT